MPDFAVRIPLTAVNGLSGPFGRMLSTVTGFGRAAGASFDQAGRRASLFGTLVGSNLVTGAIRGLLRQVRQLPSLLTDFTERADAISKQSRSVGLTAESFQRLQYAAGLANVQEETLQTSFEKLNQQIGQLRVGTGTLYSVVGKVNPALARQLRTVSSTEEAFLTTADAIAQASDAQTRAAIATAAFGRSGQDMLPMLLDGRIEITKLMREADKYGNVLTDKTVVAAELFNDTLTRFQGGIRFVKESVLTTLMTALQPYVEKVTEWIAANKELIAQRIDSWIQGGLSALRRMGDWYREHKTDILRFWEGLKSGAQTVAGAIRWAIENKEALIAIAVAWKGMQLGMGALSAVSSLSGLAGATGAVGGLATAAGGAASALGAIGPIVAGIAGAAALVIALAKLNERIMTERDPHAKLLRDVEAGKAFDPNLPTSGTWQEALANKYAGLGLPTAPVEAPNAAAMDREAQAAARLDQIRVALDNKVQFQVDNTAAPGVTTRIRRAPVATGAPGAQYGGSR